MKKITIISAVYPPEPVVSARMSHDLANYLTAQGCQVTVLCPQPSRGGTYKGYRKSHQSLVACEHGVEVVRLPSYAAAKSKLLDRFVESYSFGRHVYQYLSRQTHKPDALYVNAWPLISQAMIARYAGKNEVPVILQIMDIYPESLLNKLNKTARKVMGPPLTLMDAWIAKKAKYILVISETMRNTYINSRKIDPEKIKVINVWQDEESFQYLPEREAGCKHYHVPKEKFTFLYFGNIGAVAGVDLLIRAFCQAALPEAQLIIAGEGSEKSKCEQEAKRLGASDIHFISEPDAEKVPLIQSLADVCLLPLKKGAAISSVPSKLAAYMFSAKPVLATVDADSDTALFIHQAKCGWVGEPGNMDWLAKKMREASELQKYDIDMIGQRGRQFGFLHFSKSKGVRRLAGLILKNA